MALPSAGNGESEARPRRRARLAVAAGGGLAIAVLSVVPAWFEHVRNVGGHGLTAISVTWSAWEGRAWPFGPATVVLAVLVALLALVGLARRDLGRPWLLGAGSLLILGLLLGSLLPLDRLGHASSVHIEPAWALIAASVVALAIAAISWPGRDRRLLGLGMAALVVLTVLTYGGRVVALNLAEGDPRHYADGSYRREAGDGQPAETLTIRDGTFSVDGRWWGSLSGRGLVVVLTDDPACPDARGAYRVFAAGDEDIRWDLIVDLCADGERGRDLTTGIWRRVR